MKKIKSILSIACLMLLAYQTTAQDNEYRFNVSGKLVVNGINKISFEGYDGNEVILSTTIKSSRNSERAEGLKLINGSGLEDNSGLGVSVTTENGNTTLEEISKRSSRRYKIKVPKDVTIFYKHSTAHGSKVTFSNIEGEIEVKTVHSGIELDEVTGPMTISTVHGKIEGAFSTVNQDAPISIVSTHGLIDIAIPENTKADLSLSTEWGEIYSDLDIAIERNSNLTSYSSNKVRGTLNGGGVNLKLASNHGRIYLRKK